MNLNALGILPTTSFSICAISVWRMCPKKCRPLPWHTSKPSLNATSLTGLPRRMNTGPSGCCWMIRQNDRQNVQSRHGRNRVLQGVVPQDPDFEITFQYRTHADMRIEIHDEKHCRILLEQIREHHRKLDERGDTPTLHRPPANDVIVMCALQHYCAHVRRLTYEPTDTGDLS